MTTPTPQEFERRAQEGDVDAQYALAAILAQRGMGDLALGWLRKAAASGHKDALYTLAGHLLTKTEGAAVHREDAVAGLRMARERGSVAATRVIAALVAADLIAGGGWVEALALMREACDGNDAAAFREVAAVLLGDDEEDADGAAMMREAARRDKLAAALLERRRRRGRRESSDGYDLDHAFEKLAAIAGRLGAGARSDICKMPNVRAFKGAIGVDLCDHLIGRALPRLRRQAVMTTGSSGARIDPERTAWGAGLGFGFADFPATVAGTRMSLLAGVPYSHGEALAILRYQPGQEYRPHHDFLAPDVEDFDLHGQRIRTALLYLNDGYSGGETHFLTPDIRYVGRTGDVLVFDNVDANGAPDVAARHAGRPVERGEKWLASLWLRDRPFSD